MLSAMKSSLNFFQEIGPYTLSDIDSMKVAKSSSVVVGLHATLSMFVMYHT